MITRLILSDIYVYIQCMYTEDEIDEEIDNLYKIYHRDNYYYDNDEYYNMYENFNDEYDDEYDDDYNDLDDLEKDIDMKILKHIENCANNNIYILPNDDELRTNILSYFIIYNTYTDNTCKSFDIETIEKDTEKKLIFKKVNPLYKFDTIDLNTL